MLSEIKIKLICIGLVIVFFIYAACFLYNSGYNNGMGDCRVEMTAQLQKVRDANEKAMNSTRLALLEEIKNLQNKNKSLEDEISTIDKKAIADPNANTCGISINSVRRLNTVH